MNSNIQLKFAKCKGGEYMESGLRIKLKRIEKGHKQYVLAQQVGISREYLRLIENGKANNPSVQVMKKISEILETSVQELFFSDKE